MIGIAKRTFACLSGAAALVALLAAPGLAKSQDDQGIAAYTVGAKYDRHDGHKYYDKQRHGKHYKKHVKKHRYHKRHGYKHYKHYKDHKYYGYKQRHYGVPRSRHNFGHWPFHPRGYSERQRLRWYQYYVRRFGPDFGRQYGTRHWYHYFHAPRGYYYYYSDR